MRVWGKGIDDEDGAGRLRQARGISDDDGGVSRGRGIYDASKRLETTMEAAGAIRRARGIYYNDGGIGGGS